MTDFLAGLLDRALDRAPVVQRRRPSRFEPTPGNQRPKAPWFDKSWQHAQEEEIPGVETAEIRESPGWRAVAPRRHRVAAPAAASVEKENVEPASSSPLAAEVGSGVEARKESRRADALLPVKEPPRTGRRTLPSNEMEVVLRKQEARAVKNQPPALRVVPTRRRDSDESDADSPRRPTPHVQPVVANVNSEPARETWRREPAPPPGPQRSPERSPVVITKVQSPPAVAPMRSARPMRERLVQARQASPGPPAIQVTIGRVEVRATASYQPRERATPKAAPKLNLEDYLRSRGGGAK